MCGLEEENLFSEQLEGGDVMNCQEEKSCMAREFMYDMVEQRLCQQKLVMSGKEEEEMLWIASRRKG